MGKGKSKVKKKQRRMKERIALQEANSPQDFMPGEYPFRNSRKVCAECGREITNQTELLKIYSDEVEGIVNICKICHTLHLRKKLANHGNG